MKSLYLSGIVGYEITADYIRSQISEGSKEKLQVIVNSPGGFVIDAFEIYNIFSSYKGEVEFVINGMAASAMSYIIMSGDKISAFKNSIFMAHKAQAMAIGDSDDMQREADITKAMDNILAESYVKRMKKPKEEILQNMKNEIWHIGWEALTEAGIIDNVIDSPDEIEIPDEETKQQIVFADEAMKPESAKLKIIECANRMARDIDRVKTNSMKAAALLPTQKQESIPEEIQVEDIKITEEKMNLQEFLKANPEAEAEYRTDLLSAKEQGKAEMTGTQNVIIKVLDYEKIKVSDEAKKAIMGEMTLEAYMDFVILNKNEAPKAGEPVFSGIKTKQLPQDFAPDIVAEVKPEEIRAKVKNVLDSIGGI